MLRNRKIRMFAALMAGVLFTALSTAAQERNPDEWTQKELKAATANAKTATDHLRVAKYYRLEAARLESEAKKHASYGEKFTTRTGRHCRWLAAELEKKAQKALLLANAHDGMAMALAKQGT